MKNADGLGRPLSQFNGQSGIFAQLKRLTFSFLGASALGLILNGCSAPDNPTPQQPTAAKAASAQAILISSGLKEEKPESRVIRLSGEVTTEMATAIIDKMIELSKADPKADIELRINSPGGSVDAGMAIYDVMQSLPNDIRTVCEGEAQSMAAVLLVAGAQGKRYAYPHCTVMMHQPSWGARGKITDMQIITAQGVHDKKRMAEVLSLHTGQPLSTMYQLFDRELYPHENELKEMGIIDHIMPQKLPKVESKSKLPDNFCNDPGRQHIPLCNP